MIQKKNSLRFRFFLNLNGLQLLADFIRRYILLKNHDFSKEETRF